MKLFLLCSSALLLTLAISCKKDKKKDDPVTDLPPVISGIIPSQGIGGTDIIIRGEGFSSVATDNEVKINNLLLTVKQASDTLLLVTLPNQPQIGKITIKKDSDSSTSAHDFWITDDPRPHVRLKQYLDGHQNMFDFEYDNNNRLTIKRESFINPINHLIFPRATSEYTYNATGLVEKEVYTPIATPNEKKMWEFGYTDGQLTSLKVSTVNTTNPSAPAINVVEQHDYVIIGGQLVKATNRNASGTIISVETFEYDFIDENPRVTRRINPATGASSEEIYIQVQASIDPYALYIPGPPPVSLFFIKSAVFPAATDQNFMGYPGFGSTPTSYRQEYLGGSKVYVANYTYETI